VAYTNCTNRYKKS